MAKNSNYHRADVALLRAENEALKEKGTFLEEKNALLERQLSQQSAQIEELKRKLEHMNEVFANAQRAQYGQKSEKQQYVLGEDQVSLFNEAEASQDHKAAEPTEQTLVAAHSRKKKKTLEEKIKELPVEEIIMDLPEDQLTCSCGGTFRLIGKKFIRQEMIIIPQSEKILKYYSCTYACDKCEKDTGYAHILTTKTPPPLMKHSIASPSTVADVMTKKYADGLPLARQEKIWKRYGVELSRATLANWVIQCSQSWLKPLYKHMRQQLLEERVIHADETVVQVLKEEGKTVTSESRMWMYASGEYSKKPIRPFAVGRKNWLFCDSVKGADSSAIVYSMVETAKVNGMEPYDYLLLVLSILPSWGRAPSHEKLETLMPWHPDVKQRRHIREDKTE